MSKETFNKIYHYHHTAEKREDFVSFGMIKGKLFSEWIGREKKILDLGCRDGALTKYFIEGNEVLGVDADCEALKRCEEKLNIKTKWLDLNNDWDLPKEFDVVVASEVLEHLYFPEKVLEGVKNVLKEDGLFIGSVPNAFSLKNRFRILFGRKKGTPLNDPVHINHFSYKELKQILSKEFKQVEVYPLVQEKYAWLAKIFPSLISYQLIFKCKNK